MPKQDGNIKIVESFITSNKPMSLNNKNIYYNEYSDEVLIRYYQTLIAVRKDKSVRILEGINSYSASTNVLVRLIERIAKEKGCTVTYVKQFAKGSTVKGVFSKYHDEYKLKIGDSVVVTHGSNKGIKGTINSMESDFTGITIKTNTGHILYGFDDADLDKYAKGSTVKGSKWSHIKTNDEYRLVKGEKQVRIGYLKNVSFNDITKLVAELNGNTSEYFAVSFYLTNLGMSNDKNSFGSVFLGYETENDEDNRFNVFNIEEPIAEYIGSMKKFVKEWHIEENEEYAKGSTVKGKDFSGNYYSTNDFVGAHNLQKEAEKILGKGWEAEDDVNQIESIINSLGGKYVVTVPEDRSQWNEMREQYDLAKPTNDSNYDIFVISESDFKYGNGGGVAVSSESGLAVGTNADLLMNQQNLQYADGGGLGEYIFKTEIGKEINQYINEIIIKADTNSDANGYGIVISNWSVTVNPDMREDFWEDMDEIQDAYSVQFQVSDFDDLIIITDKYEGEFEFSKGGNMSSGFNYSIGGL